VNKYTINISNTSHIFCQK